MPTRPGYIWSGTEWVSIGQEAVVAPVSYQASAPSTPSTGDIWIDSNDDVPGIDTSQFLRWRKTAVGGETSVSGTDDNGLTLQYTANYEQVYLNGVLLVRSQDYTATNGTSITGLTALAANDVVEVFGVVARVVGDVYTQAQTNSLLDAKSNVSSTGLVLLNTTTVSAVSTTSINNVFSSSYDNYRVVGRLTFTASTNFGFRLRGSSTDRSSNYYGGGGGYRYDGNAIGTSTGLSSTNFTLFATYLDTPSSFAFDVYSPFSATSKTTATGNWFSVNNAGFDSGGFFGQWYSVATQDDGLTFFPSSGNMTGTIKVYGYK